MHQLQILTVEISHVITAESYVPLDFWYFLNWCDSALLISKFIGILPTFYLVGIPKYNILVLYNGAVLIIQDRSTRIQIFYSSSGISLTFFIAFPLYN